MVLTRDRVAAFQVWVLGLPISQGCPILDVLSLVFTVSVSHSVYYGACVTHLSSSRSSSSAFAAFAMFRGFGFFRNATCSCGSSSRENQSLRVPFETRSCESSSWITRAGKMLADSFAHRMTDYFHIPACKAWNSACASLELPFGASGLGGKALLPHHPSKHRIRRGSVRSAEICL